MEPTYNNFINNRNISFKEAEIFYSKDEVVTDKKTLQLIEDNNNKYPFRICGVYRELSFSSKNELYSILQRYNLAYDFVFENDSETYFKFFTQNQPYVYYGWAGFEKQIFHLQDNIKGTAKFQLLTKTCQNDLNNYFSKNSTYVFNDKLIFLPKIHTEYKHFDYLELNGMTYIPKYINFHFEEIVKINLLNPDPIIDYYISFVKKLNRTNLYEDEMWSLK